MVSKKRNRRQFLGSLTQLAAASLLTDADLLRKGWVTEEGLALAQLRLEQKAGHPALPQVPKRLVRQSMQIRSAKAMMQAQTEAVARADYFFLLSVVDKNHQNRKDLWAYVYSDGSVYEYDNAFTANNLRIQTRGVDLYSGNGQEYNVQVFNEGMDHLYVDGVYGYLPRTGSDTTALIEGLNVQLPSAIYQSWTGAGALEGAVYGMQYVIAGNGQTLKYVGPSSNPYEWGGTTPGVTVIDGKAYRIPNFWQRQARMIQVDGSYVVMCMNASSRSLFRSGESFRDRFVVMDAAPYMSTLNECIRSRAPQNGLRDKAKLCRDADNLPYIDQEYIRTLAKWYEIDRPGGRSSDADIQKALDKHTQMILANWDASYADHMPHREFAGDPNNDRTTVAGAIYRGGRTYAERTPGVLTWRDYGDHFWNDGASSNHYDILYTLIRIFLEHPNADVREDLLCYIRNASEHQQSVDLVHPSLRYQFQWSGANAVGMARYEKNGHDLNQDIPKPSHTWPQGLGLSYWIFRDPWTWDAYSLMATGSYVTNWEWCQGETRIPAWQLLSLVSYYWDSGAEWAFQRAIQLARSIIQAEIDSGSKGYFAYSNCAGSGLVGQAQSIMPAYNIVPLIFVWEACQRRGLGEWTDWHTASLVRQGSFAFTPMSQGGMMWTPSDTGEKFHTWPFIYCTTGSCATPTSSPGNKNDRVRFHALYFSDFADALRKMDSVGTNRKTGLPWSHYQKLFAVEGTQNFNPEAYLGYLNYDTPGTETKAWTFTAGSVFNHSRASLGGHDLKNPVASNYEVALVQSMVQKQAGFAARATQPSSKITSRTLAVSERGAVERYVASQAGNLEINIPEALATETANLYRGPQIEPPLVPMKVIHDLIGKSRIGSILRSAGVESYQGPNLGSTPAPVEIYQELLDASRDYRP